MKTKIKLLLFSFALLACANTYAQNSVNDLFNTFVIIPAQQRIQILTDELDQVNADIVNIQDEIANSASSAVTTEQALQDPDFVAPVSPLTAQLAELQAKATELQNALTFWQAQLTLWLSFNTQQQEQYLVLHSDQFVTNTGEEMASVLSNQNRLGAMPDANNPWIVPVFVSTGDAQQDADLVTQWLIHYGLLPQDADNQ